MDINLLSIQETKRKGEMAMNKINIFITLIIVCALTNGLTHFYLDYDSFPITIIIQFTYVAYVLTKKISSSLFMASMIAMMFSFFDVLSRTELVIIFTVMCLSIIYEMFGDNREVLEK